jgi:hypothetical protein
MVHYEKSHPLSYYVIPPKGPWKKPPERQAGTRNFIDVNSNDAFLEKRQNR